MQNGYIVIFVDKKTRAPKYLGGGTSLINVNSTYDIKGAYVYPLYEAAQAAVKSLLESDEFVFAAVLNRDGTECAEADKACDERYIARKNLSDTF